MTTKNPAERDVKQAFATWLEITYLDWQAGKQKRASLQELADHIGYSRPLISLWLAGQRLPTPEGIERLSELFGPEIYDVLGIPRPNPFLQKISQAFGSIPADKQQKLAQDAERFEAEALKNERSKNASKKRKTI